MSDLNQPTIPFNVPSIHAHEYTRLHASERNNIHHVPPISPRDCSILTRLTITPFTAPGVSSTDFPHCSVQRLSHQAVTSFHSSYLFYVSLDFLCPSFSVSKNIDVALLCPSIAKRQTQSSVPAKFSLSRNRLVFFGPRLLG